MNNITLLPLVLAQKPTLGTSLGLILATTAALWLLSTPCQPK
jgi:hypothetical protein